MISHTRLVPQRSSGGKNWICHSNWIEMMIFPTCIWVDGLAWSALLEPSFALNLPKKWLCLALLSSKFQNMFVWPFFIWSNKRCKMIVSLLTGPSSHSHPRLHQAADDKFINSECLLTFYYIVSRFSISGNFKHVETFCNQFLDFQFRQFGLFPPSIWCLVSLCLSVSPPPSRWTCCRSRDDHCWSAFRFTAAEKTVFRVELMVHLSLVSLSPSARPLGWRAHFCCWFYKNLKLRPGTPAPLFVEANYKGAGKPARDKTHLDVCPWPRCVCPSALLRAVPGQMALVAVWHVFYVRFVAASRE